MSLTADITTDVDDLYQNPMELALRLQREAEHPTSSTTRPVLASPSTRKEKPRPAAKPKKLVAPKEREKTIAMTTNDELYDDDQEVYENAPNIPVQELPMSRQELTSTDDEDQDIYMNSLLAQQRLVEEEEAQEIYENGAWQGEPELGTVGGGEVDTVAQDNMYYEDDDDDEIYANQNQ